MRRSRRRSVLASIAVLLVAALVGRALLPLVLEDYLNHVLSRSGKYAGHVGDVDVHLWRGAYTVRDVRIEKRDGAIPVPFLRAPRVDFTVEWKQLRRGAFVSDVVFERPELNFVAGPSPRETQTGRGGDWRATFERLFPVRINRVDASDGTIHFRNFHSDPPVDVYLRGVRLVAHGLANRRQAGEEMPAALVVRATPMNQGRLVSRARFDPLSRVPTFDLDGVVSGADLRQWNDFLRAYAGIDVQAGRLALYAELLARKGGFEGYVKPFFADVDVLRIEEEWDDQSPFATLWELLVELGAELLQNHGDERLATRIPLRGSARHPEAEFWPALGNVLRDAFVEAFVPRLERSVGRDREAR